MRRLTRRTLTAAGLGLTAMAVMIGLAGSAQAHALLVSSVPAADTTLGVAPSTVTITFSERPAPALSQIQVLNSSGQVVDAGPTVPVAGRPLELRVTVQPLTAGVYTVTWRTVSSVDGHLATGSYAFGVQVPIPGAALARTQAVTSPRPSAAAIVGRGLLYVGLVVVLGIGFVGALIIEEPPPLLLRVLPWGWACAAVGVVVMTLAQHHDTGVSWHEFLTSSLGSTLVHRVIAALLTAAFILVALVCAGRVRRLGLVLAGIGAAASMLVDVVASHAAAQAPVALNVALQWLHILAVGFWIGGLAALLLAVRGSPSPARARAVRRFSMAAGIALGVLAVSGGLRAVLEVRTFGHLLHTGFGQLLLVKTALLVLLVALGAINRYRNVAQAPRRLAGLRRAGSAELAVAAVAIFTAAALVNVAPPLTTAPAGASLTSALSRQVVLHGSDFGTTVQVRLEVSPGLVGFNRFVAHLSDYDSATPAHASAVRLAFSLPARPQIGSSTLALRRSSPGVYEAAGANISLPGAWQIEVLVERAAGSVEIPLHLTAHAPRPAWPVSGELTLGGRAGQDLVGLSLLPGTPGRNQVTIDVVPPAGEQAAAGLAVRISAGAHSEPTSTCGPSCRSARLAIRPGERLSVAVGGASGGTATFVVPMHVAGAGALLARADHTMAALRTYEIDEHLTSGTVTVVSRYTLRSPNRMALAIQGGGGTVIIGTTSYSRSTPAGRWTVEKGVPQLRVPTFVWDEFKPFMDVRVLGTQVLDGHATTIVGFFGRSDGTPCWFELWIDHGGLVRAAQMRAQAHFMNDRYSAFDAPLVVSPPAR